MGWYSVFNIGIQIFIVFKGIARVWFCNTLTKLCCCNINYTLYLYIYIPRFALTLYVLQACDITGGLYLKIPQKIALAQYLLVSVQYRFPLLSESRLSVEGPALC